MYCYKVMLSRMSQTHTVNHKMNVRLQNIAQNVGRLIKVSFPYRYVSGNMIYLTEAL